MHRPGSTGLTETVLEDVLLQAAVKGKYAFYRWGNVAINVWNTQPTGPIVDCLAELTAQTSRIHPEGISSVHWVVGGMGLPTGEARAGLRRLAVQYRDHVKCVAVVIDGGGFWASAVRSALNGVVMAADTHFVPRIYANVDGLVDWLPDAHLVGTGTRIRPSALRARIIAATDATLRDA